MKVSKFLVAAACVSLSTVFAQGLKFDGSNTERFSYGKDPKVGLTATDSYQKLTFMRCLVDQEFSEDSKVCLGGGKSVTFQQATVFASGIGNGWRLPTWWEVEAAKDYVMKAMASGKEASRGKYGGGGWDCDGRAVWTITGVQGAPNLVNAALCTEFSSGANLKSVEVSRQGGDTARIILVKKSN